MKRPCAVRRRRAHVWRVLFQNSSGSHIHRFLLVVGFVLALLPFSASPVHAAPQFWLPTPVGERWKVIQGYGCGTHNSWDKYAFDMVSVDGQTSGAPIRAAADGKVFVWVAGSGTLIIRHEGGVYSQYTHMSSTTVRVGQTVKRGDQVGAAGARGAPGNPHLHFHIFTADGSYASHRRTIPLEFADGYSFPDVGGCNQHFGAVVVAGGEKPAAPEQTTLNFSGVQAGQWYNHDVSIAVSGNAIANGIAVAWENQPNDSAAPQPAPDNNITVNELASRGEGLHTLFVRGWDNNGKRTDASFGPIGYDSTAPIPSEPIAEQHINANSENEVVRWNASQDAASGVAGYRVYVGDDPQGVSEWFVTAPEVSLPALPPGSYTLRIQPFDFAGNSAEWSTVGTITAR